MIDDKAGQPVDFRFIEVNSAFTRQTGLPVKDIMGRTAGEVMPGMEKHWIEAYSRVVRTGISERFESHLKS